MFAGIQQNVTQLATQGFTQFVATGKVDAAGMGQKVLSEFENFGGNIPGLNRVMTALRGYFAVDNDYVQKKMVRVLFPFLNKEGWRRKVSALAKLM